MEWRNPFRRRDKTPAHLRPLAASAVQATTRYDGDAARRQDRRVSEAWDMYRLVGEVHYATRQQARLVGRLGWFVTINGNQVDSEPADEILKATFGSLSVLRDLQVTAAIHLQVAGGYHLAKTGDRWEILANPAEGPVKKKLENADLVVTVENPDPRDPSTRLDSPVLAALDIARELILSRGQARAMARNRTAQLGLLLYPLEGAGQDTRAFEQRLIDVIAAPLADEMSTASVVPNLVGFPSEFIEQIRSIDLTGDLDDKIHERIDKLVHQLAVILDIPIEILEGSGDANHWAAWLVQEDNYLNHVEPLASPIGEGFAEAMELLLNGDTGTDTVEITPDPENLLQRRPTIDHALKAAELGVTNEEWTRTQVGATDEDAGPGVMAMMEARRATRTGTNEDAPAAQEPAQAAAAQAPAAIEPAPEPVVDADAVDVAQLAELDVQFGEAMSDLVTDAAERSLERLGAQLRSIAQGGKVDLPDVPNREVAIAFTQPIQNQAATVEDTATRFRPQFDRFVTRAFDRVRAAGVDLAPDRAEIESAFSAYVAEVAKTVDARRAGRTGDTETWKGSLRVNSILGGNGDPERSPVVSATGYPSSVQGIALGRRSIGQIAATYGVVPGKGCGTTPTPAQSHTRNTLSLTAGRSLPLGSSSKT
jgi:hypothetical protein